MSTLSAQLPEPGFEFRHDSFHSSPSPQATFNAVAEVPSIDSMKKPKRNRKPKSVNEKVERKLRNQKFQCKWDGCDLYFGDTATLKDHLEDHIGRGLSVYQCKWEGCTFGERKKRDHMKSHIRKHHQFVGFFCQSCGEGFVRDQELRKHVCTNPDGHPTSDSHAYYSDSSNTSSQQLPSSPNTSEAGSPSPLASHLLPPPAKCFDPSKFNLHPLASFNYNGTLILDQPSHLAQHTLPPHPTTSPSPSSSSSSPAPSSSSSPPFSSSAPSRPLPTQQPLPSLAPFSHLHHPHHPQHHLVPHFQHANGGIIYAGGVPSHEISSKRGRDDDDDLLRWLSSLESGNVEPACNQEVIYELESMMTRFEEEPACFDRLAPAISQHYPFFKKLKQDIEESGFSSDQDIEDLFDLDDQTLYASAQPLQPPMMNGMTTGHEHMVVKRGLVNDAQLTFASKPISFRRGGEEDSSEGTESEEEEEEGEESEEEDEGEESEGEEEGFDEVTQGFQKVSLAPRKPRRVKDLLDFIGTMILLGQP